VCVVNVKPADQLVVPEVAEALAWAGEVFAARGWRHAIHHALLTKDAPPVQIAADLGISLGHLRQVLRRNRFPPPPSSPPRRLDRLLFIAGHPSITGRHEPGSRQGRTGGHRAVRAG
jgi:hypothetical protein